MCCSTSTGRARSSCRQQARDDLVSVFVLPPVHDELERRLRTRAQDTEEVVRRAHGQGQRRDQPLGGI